MAAALFGTTFSVQTEETQTGKTKDGVRPRTERRTLESDIDGDGEPDITYVKLLRGGQLVFYEAWDRFSNQRARMYYRNGKLVLIEGDNDNDGWFETVLIMTGEETIDCVLERTKDGTTRFAEPETAMRIMRGYMQGKAIMDPLVRRAKAKMSKAGGEKHPSPAKSK